MENPIKMDDLGVPLFSETSSCIWKVTTLGARPIFHWTMIIGGHGSLGRFFQPPWFDLTNALVKLANYHLLQQSSSTQWMKCVGWNTFDVTHGGLVYWYEMDMIFREISESLKNTIVFLLGSQHIIPGILGRCFWGVPHNAPEKIRANMHHRKWSFDGLFLETNHTPLKLR